ncbi:MAG: TetR family transcriptional regulator [Candidatus Azobacteroides sp.]|nr:TetR family transcriptional regulator [Candidatus Azobacteroides sp.]
MAVLKTRDVLVEVARQFFAKMGVGNTTMNDIAQASKKGRRTLYTYFKSKNDIYLAVVESELNQLQEILNKVGEKNLEPEEKLKVFIFTRLEAVKEVVLRNGNLHADFFRDITRVEKVRKKFDLQEIQIIKKILNEGVEKKVFHLFDVDMSATVLHFALKGIEVPYIKGIFDGKEAIDRVKQRNEIVSILLHGINAANKD